MSAEVKILIEGFTNADFVAESGEEKTQPTVTLIKDGELTIVVDPGILESQQDLVSALAKENLKLGDINIVAITHSHLDHYRNVGMFADAKTLDYWGLWSKNTVEDWHDQFSPNIQIIRTPGHDYTSITFFVNTNKGVVAVCGDVFWRENYALKFIEDRFASDAKKLDQSRKLVIKMADWIIPGHGPIFKSPKNIIESVSQAVNLKNGKTVLCKKCHSPLKSSDICLCRPWFCFKCCECDIDCDFCNCGHKSKYHKFFK